jgi:holliday junction DNA helicase RuvA
MIGFISGKIIGFLEEKVIMRLPSGLGYLITIDPKVDMILNENFEFYVLEVFRDTGSELFGFRSIEERLWVEKLIGVDGVGPKTATNIVYTLGIATIKSAIDNQDDGVLSQVKGISGKTAKKIILELHNKNVDIKTLNQNRVKPINSSIATNFTETLSSLGYSRGQIVSAITTMKQDGNWQDEDLNALVKSALKLF